MSDYVKLGSFTPYHNVRQATIEMLDKLKPDIYASYLTTPAAQVTTIQRFVPTQEKTQIISGVRYAVKIQITEMSFIHVYFVKKFDNTLIFERLEVNKTSIDSL